MIFMRRNALLSFILIYSIGLYKAQDIPIGSWRDHLPYSDVVSVSDAGNIVYCATNSAVFTYDKTDFTLQKINLINGLSDIGVSKIKYNSYDNRVLIAYTNGNLDIIDENKSITNLSFIKNSSIIANKNINHIYLKNQFAYISTGFGVVVLDMDKMEILDTYIFGPNGAYLNTNAVTLDSLNIYAASSQGVYFASLNSSNLADFNNWSLLPNLGNKNYNGIVNFNNKLIVSLKNTTWNTDTLYYQDTTGAWLPLLSGININEITITTNNKLAVISDNLIYFYDKNLNNFNTLWNYNSILPSTKDVDIDNYYTYWIADENLGLVKWDGGQNTEFIYPNGPTTNKVFDIDMINNTLWFVSGGYDGSSFTSNYNNTHLYNYNISNNWATPKDVLFNSLNNIAMDAVAVTINPTNENQTFIGTWNDGLYELNNGTFTKVYDAKNSSLDSTFFGTTKVGGMAFDKNQNLWVTSAFTINNLSVKTPDNTWYAYSFPNMITNQDAVTKIIVDKNNNKWVIVPRSANILVFNDNGTLDNTSDDKKVVLTNTDGAGNIPGNFIFDIAEDLDGEIWLGTDKGVGVFYSPSQVFDQQINAQQVFIQQDGQTQILLETENVTSIAIDGANRKWFGTSNSGVFLMSADGTEEISHFTKDNSPLFSNTILDIAINQNTGEVFFATDKGLISYKGTATKSNDSFNNILVYPNPVKHDFTGTIAIRGLMKNTDVRITDISGNIVYKTKSLGGQAIWDGNDMNGNRVQTGVYMVFNGSEDGNQKKAAKILFIH